MRKLIGLVALCLIAVIGYALGECCLKGNNSFKKKSHFHTIDSRAKT